MYHSLLKSTQRYLTLDHAGIADELSRPELVNYSMDSIICKERCCPEANADSNQIRTPPPVICRQEEVFSISDYTEGQAIHVKHHKNWCLQGLSAPTLCQRRF